MIPYQPLRIEGTGIVGIILILMKALLVGETLCSLREKGLRK